MKSLAALALVLAACTATPPQTATSGPPATKPAKVKATSTGGIVVMPVESLPTTTTTHVHPVTTSTTVGLQVEYVDCGGWGDLVAAHFPAAQVPKACRVMMCESGGNPTAQNLRSTASGLAQFLDGTWLKARALVGAEQYARAKDAPGAVQIAAMGAWWRATSWDQWECA